MAETEEIATNAIDISQVAEEKVPQQNNQQQSSIPTQASATVPTVSDINFEDIADMIGNSPGDLAKLQLVDPVFEGMLMQAALPINAAPPITGSKSMNNFNPGKATQHYNPYESSTPPNLNTLEGKKKFLQQGLYDDMVNPKVQKAPGYIPDVEFGIKEANFDRYYAFDDLYDELGFHPFRNNEEIYNANSTFHDEFARTWGQTSKILSTAFTSNYRNMSAWMGIIDDENMDKNGALEYADAIRIGSSSKGGFGGFTNRLVLNSAYTVGIVANIVVEEAVLAALTAKSWGGTAPLLLARTTQNIGKLAKIKNTVKDIGAVFKSNITDRSRISAGRQLLTDLNKVENARQFFRATGTGALNFIAPSTMASIKALNTSKGVVRGIQNFKDGAKLFGGFYRDVRQLSMAVAEGKLEAGFVYNNMVDSLYHDYVAEYGNSPPMEKLDEIKQKATAASMKTLYFNVPLIYLTNRIVFSTLFQGMGGLARLTQRHQTGLGKRIFINSKATAKSSANAAKAGKVGDRILYDGGNTFLGRVKNLGVKGNFGAMGAMALRYTGANFAEGIQEVTQEIISKSAQDYYTGLFLDKGYTQSNLLESSIKNAIDAQISPQGFEVFMSGFLMGGLVQPLQQGFMVGLPSIYQWGKGTYGSEQSKAKYQEYSKNKEEFITKTIDNQNKLLEDVFSVFDPAKLNAAEQKQLNERLLQSSYSSDMLSFMDDKDHSKFSQLDYLFKTGNSNQFKQILKDWQKLTDEELIEGWPEYKKEIKANKFREKLQKFDKKIDEFQEGWDTVQDKYVNPYDPTQFSSGSLEYNSEALRYIAYDHAKKLFMYSQDTFKRSLERSNSIFERLGSDSAISNMKSSDISILLELKTLKTEIENLQSEIAIGSTTSEQQELIEKKKAKLNILQKYLNVITDPKNFTKTSKDNIPLEMKGDLVTTEEDGEDVVTIGNQKYKATRKITSEVGTFDRRKINTLRGPFFEYINFLAEENGEFIRTTDLDEILKDIVDYKFLEGRAQSYFRAIEILSDPEILLDSAKRIADRLKIVYNKHKEDVEKTVKKHVSDLEKNELINQLASQLIYPDATQVVLFFKEGIVPTIFHMESGQITPQDNPAKWDSIQNLIKTYLNRPGEETNVKPGETINEEELEDAKINDIVKQVDTEITDATKDVLIAKWKSYVQSKIGKEGAVLSWEQWQTSKSAKNIKNIRAKLNTIYLSTLTTEQQKEKSFDKWLSEEQRTPEIYRILNSEGGSYSDYIVTDSESVNTEKLNNLDKLVGESLSGINILKRKVPTQSQDDKEEYYYEIVDNDMNNLYNEYSQNDPNGNIIKDTYKTQGEAIGAQQMIVGLQPNNSKFGPNNEYHYRQILQDNNNNQFVVITTPKTFAKGGKLYLRPLEFANDKNKSFEVVDVENYKPLDFTNFKAKTKNQDILLLRQSEPIKLYAHRHDGESSEQAEVRLSERLRDLTPEEVNNLQLKVSNNPNWNKFETKKQDPDSLSPIGSKTYTNPNIKTGSEELTVAVINGREVLGYLQGPTGAVIVIDGKIINPLTLTEDNVDEYYKIYDTNKTQLKTKAEQLEIIKNNYASSIILNDKLKQLLGGDQEIIVPINKIKGLNLRVSPGKITYAPKGQGVTFSELVANTIDGKNFWITDNRSDGKGGIITNITEENIYAKAEALVNAASEQTSYNPLYTKSRYVAAVRLPNGTFTFIELKAGELSNDTKNELVIRILNEQDEVLVNNIDQENDEVKDEAATFTFNDELKNDFYIFGKTNEFIDIELTSRGDIQVIYRNTAKINKDGQALRISYTINENDVKGITKSINPFNTFLEIINTKIKFKDASLDVPSNLVLTSDNFRKSIPKSATVQDLASAVTNFQKGIRNNIRIEAVITDAAQINNIKNTSQLPSFIGNNVQQQINNTDQIIVNAEIESPELTAEYMRNLHKDKFQNVEVATIKLIARKLATKQELSPAENTIYTNTFNTDVGGNIDLLKLTYQSGVIQEGGATNVDVTTVKTSIEKTPSRKIADQINELEKQIETLEDNIFNDTYNSIVSPTGTTDIDAETDTKADTKRKANIAANEAIENSQELKNLENQVKELKKKLAPKVINKLTTENIEQIDQFTTWVKQNLPDFIQVQDIQDLSARLKENGKTVGMFTLELNAISNNIEGNIYVGTQTPFKYHEAFHGIFRMLLTETEIKKYLAIAKKEKLNELRKQGTTLAKALYELKSSHSIYNNLNKKELEERLYEEYLADKFDLFKMNPGKTETSSEVKSLFTKIIEWIKAVINRFSKNELTSLFKNIDAGKYKTSTVQLNRFTTEGLETGITSSAPKVIAIDSYENVYTDPFTGKEIVSLSSVYMPAIDQRKMIATIAALYRSYVDRGDLLIMSKRAVLDTAIRDYSRVLNPKREYYTSEQNGIEFRSIRKKLNLYYKALRTNSNVIAENVSRYLEIFDTKFQIEQEAFEENYHDENTNVRKVDEYGKNANQIGGEKSLSTELRQFIATTILEEQDLFGNKETLDGIPIVTTVDFHFAYSGLLKALSDKTNDLQMLQALATFSSTNANTAAVANNIFTRIGINDPLTLLDEEQLPKITDPNFLQKVIKGFNQFRLDYMFAHKDIDSGLVFIYEANKKDDSNSQINYWSNNYDSMYPALLTNEGKQKVTSLLNLFKSKILNPKDRSRKQLIEESQSISKNIYDQIGIYLNPTTIEYSILSSKPVRKNWEEAIVSLGLSAGVESITPDDIEEMRLSITRGENIFLDNQTEIPLTKEEEQNTPEEIKSNTGISSRLKKMAKINSVFDETVGATVFRDPKGNFIYAHQMPTFHLVKVAEMKEKDWVENKIKENEFFSKNYLLNNSKFKAHAAAGKLKITRFIGSKEGKITESENGSIIENRGLNVNQQDGVSYGESSSAEFIADVINSYIYNYNRNSQTIPLNSYTDKDGKNSQYIEAPAILKVLSDASTSDFVNFPIDKMVTLNENGETILTDHTLDALIYNMLQTEYNRVRNELDPEKAELDTIEGFNTGSNRGTKFVRTKGFITKRKSKVKVLSGVTTPMMSEVTKTNIVNNNQRIILRSGQAQSAIGLDVGQQTPITIGYMVGDEKKYKQFVLKNKGLVSVNNIDINKYIKYLGDSVSTKPIIGKKKQNVLNIGTIPFYFQRSEDMKFFDGKIEQYVYEFIPLEEANIEVGYEEKTTQPSTSVKPTIDTSREWSGDLKTRPVYTAEGVNTMRTEVANKDEHFGNPFSEAGYGNTIKVDLIADAVIAYKDWLLNGVTLVKTTNKVDLNTYLKPFEAQRNWILNQINEGKLDSATLLYAGKSANRGQGMHPTALAEVVEQLRTTQSATSVNLLVEAGVKPTDMYGNAAVEEFDKDLAQKIQDKLERLYPEIKLNITNNPVWEQGDNIFNQKEFNNQVNYRLKATEILLSDKAKQIFAKGKKNNWNLNKILTELQVPKEQKQIILDKNITDKEDIITSLLADNSFVIEVNTTKETLNLQSKTSDSFTLNNNDYDKSENKYYKHPEDTEEYFISKYEISKDEYDAAQNTYGNTITPTTRNTQNYANLTVPGGTNYTENEIATPDIIPNIQGHAQFSTNNGIGWFRSDDKAITSETETEKDNIRIGQLREMGYSEQEISEMTEQDTGSQARILDGSKTRRILEVQSDLFQKGRDKENLSGEVNYEGFYSEEANDSDMMDAVEAMYYKDDPNYIPAPSRQERIEELENKYEKENNFLQLLNKDNNWVTFFVKSIIQDSAKKGYEKVLFPKGNTASKVEGHTTLEEFKKQKEGQIAQLEKQKGYWDSRELKEEEDKSGKFYRYYRQGVAINGTYLTKEDAENAKKAQFETYDRQIEQFKQELERVEKEGFAALKPIFKFYEENVFNILKKLGYNPVLITDEYGNTWYEVTINPARDLANVLLQRNETNKIIGQSNIKAGTVLIDAVNQKIDTIPHEYAHHYIAWFRDTAIVKEAIKKWGSEEALVQSIGEQVVKQKGEALNWWNNFVKWLLNKLNSLSKLEKQELTQILTDAFLTRQDLSTQLSTSVEGLEVINEEPVLFEVDNFIEENLIIAANEGLNFDEAVKRIGEDKLKEIIENRIFTDFYDFKRTLINSRAISKLSVEITDGLGTIIRPQKGKKGTPYYQVTNKGREAMKLFNLKENNVDYNLAQIFMHQYINARSMNDLMLGDHALLFENFTNEIKRAKMQNNAGPSAASPLVAPELGINHTFNSNNSIQLLTYHDPKTLKRFSDGTFSDLDAQLFGTVKAFKHLWFGVNGLSPAMADLLSKIEKNEEISADDFWGNKKLGIEGYKSLGAVLNSKKFVYGDGQTNLKISFLPLIPQLTSYIDEFGEWQPLPQMEFLHNLRVKLEEIEVGTESVSIAVPVSGSKMMKKNVITVDEMFNNESIKTIQERYKDRNGNNTNIITGLHPKWMRLQVANPSGSVSGIDPRQMKQLVTTEQTDIVDVVINGKSYSIKEIKEAYHSSISNQVILRYRNKRNLIFNLETALDEIGNSIDAGKITANLSAFLNYATPALEASQAKTQKLEFFSFDEVGNPKYDLNNSITIDDFIKLFLSFFSKGVLSGNQPEVTVALVSSYGVKPMRIVKKLDENGQPIDTEIIRIATWKNLKNKPKIADKFIEGENGKPGKWVDLKVGDVILQELQHNVYDPESKTYYSEFMMPAHFRELSKFIKPGDIIPYAVAVALGIRIPSQDKHSAMSLRLVDFLPDVYGSSAMFAKELIEISGADFDIDKLYAHIKQWYYSKGKFNEYGKAKTDKGRYAEYIRFIISDVNKKGSGISDAVIKWSTNNSAFLNEEEVENLQDELARKTASELTINMNLFKNTYSAKVISYILELNDEITDEQVIKLYNKNEDLYGALQSLGLPVTFKEYNDYIKKHKGAEPYEAAINNDILDQRIALIANDGIIKPKNKRKVGIGNEPADLQPLNEIKEFLKSTFPELADFANPEDIDPDNMLGLFETWSSIKNGEGGIGAAVRPNIVLNMLAENKIKIVSGVETNSQIRFNKITFDTFGTEYSQDGKTNDTAVRTQYLISSLITMMTDNAKERLADVLSINKSSLAVVTTWSSLGVPIKTSILMLKNPAIKLGYDLAINKATPISPGITTILSNRMAYLKKDFDISNESVTDQILIDQINNDWLNISEPLTTGFGENITGQIPKEYTDKEASIEYAILKQFVIARTLTDYTAKLGSLTDLLSGFGRDTSKIDQTNQDFKDLGIGLSDIEFNKLKTRNGSPIPIDVRSLFKSNDFRATYYKIFKEVDNLLSVVFITRTPNFIKIKDTVVANMIQNNMFVSPERVNVIEKDILSYLTITTYKQFLLNSENGLEKLASLQNGLIYDEEGGKNVTTISEVVKNIQSYFRDKGQENYFINKFVSLDLATSDINKSGINRLKANNWSKISDSKAVELQVSFAEIYSEPALRIYAYDLIHYLLVKDGMQFKNNSFLNAVPAFMFDRILSSISTGHSILKSKTSTTANYSLVFGKSSEELANDFVHGYLLSNQNNWLLPNIKNIGKEETKPVHINKEGDLIINLFQGIKRFINKKGENVIKGKKYKFTVEGKSIFVNQKSKEYSVLAKNIGYLSNKGFTFNTVIDGNKKYLEIIFPLYIKNTYSDAFKNSYSKTFELQETGREKRFSKSGDIMNMLDDEDLTAKGYQAVYKEVEPVGSNQVTPISFVFGNVPTYKSLKEKYKSDPMDALIKSSDPENIDGQVNAIFNNLDTSEIQALYNEANISGSEIKTTNKTVTINNESIDTNPEIIDNFDNIDIATESKSIIDSQIAATENMLKLLNVKKENSSKSDLELKAINDWWNSLDSTDKFKAQKATKRSGIDGILNEFNTFDGTAERFIDIIKNCT